LRTVAEIPEGRPAAEPTGIDDLSVRYGGKLREALGRECSSARTSLWLADVADQVFKLGQMGKVLLTLGKRVSQERDQTSSMRRPTWQSPPTATSSSAMV
jgi:hypothetical protein